MSVGMPIFNKQQSLVTLVRKWSGSDSSITWEEFLSGIESVAKIGHWSDPNRREIAVLKLMDSAKLFFKGCTELHAEAMTWKVSRMHLGADMRMCTDKYHVTKLQTARQKKYNLRKN